MNRKDWVFLGSMALLKVILHLPVLNRYGSEFDSFGSGLIFPRRFDDSCIH